MPIDDELDALADQVRDDLMGADPAVQRRRFELSQGTGQPHDDFETEQRARRLHLHDQLRGLH